MLHILSKSQSKLAFKFSLLLLIIIPIIITNLIVDPANLYKGERYEQGIANLLLQNKNVANIGDCDQMLIQKFYIENLNEKKDVLVLGSSKLLQLDSSFFPNQKVANHAMAGSSIDDDMTIYFLYKNKNLIPQKIVLGLDPWLINKSAGNQPYMSIASTYLKMSKSFDIKISFSDKILLHLRSLDRYSQLLSPSYFQSSIKTLVFNREKSNDYYPTENVFEDSNVKLKDGSLSLNKKAREKSVDEINQQALLYVSKENDNVDEFQKEKIEKFVKILKSDGVEIIMLIVPYQPKTYNLLTNRRRLKIVDISKNYFQEVARIENIKIIGSYNPADYLLSEGDFYDGVHIKASALRKILQN